MTNSCYSNLPNSDFSSHIMDILAKDHRVVPQSLSHHQQGMDQSIQNKLGIRCGWVLQWALVDFFLVKESKEMTVTCCVAVLSCLVMSDSLRPHELQPARLLCPWNSPGKNTGVGCHALLQGIFPTQGSNPDLQHCRWILYWLSHTCPKKMKPLDFFPTLKYEKSWPIIDIKESTRACL